MKIVIAADSFKGSLTSAGVVDAVRRGVGEELPGAQVVGVPVADGGEGTVDAFHAAAGGTLREETVRGPLGRPVRARYGILPDGTAVIEMAQASGLTLLSQAELNPLCATTYGTGELVRAALDRGCRRFILGLGGSATNDGGAGFAEALGARFLDAEGAPLSPGGGALAKLAAIDCSGLDPRLQGCEFWAASDVSNPLCGPYGASAVYGPQKGAGGEEIARLDAALANYARVLEAQLGRSIARQPSAGAAGGLGAALLAFCGAEIRSGIELLLDAARFEELLRDTALVVTGEGRIDGQSAYGKVPAGVARRTKMAGDIPVVAIVGCVGEGADALYDLGIDAILPIAEGAMTLKESMQNADALVRKAAKRMIRLLRAGAKIKF